MSRCFPFPPPGYEKKLRVEDVTLLAKRNYKERKHEKDKNKEKKEGREKDKEKSREKHKERDKEKCKLKDKDKNEKKRSHHEKRFEGDGSNAEKLGSHIPQSSCVQVFEQRIDNLDGATGSKFDQMANGQRDNCRSIFPEVPFAFSDGGEQRKVQISRPMENIINKSIEGKETQKQHNSNKNGFKYTKIDPPEEVAIARELEQRIRDQNGATGSHGGSKVDVTTHNRAWNSGEVGNGNGISETKEGSIIRNGSYRLENGHNDNNLSDFPRVAAVHNVKTEERGHEVAGNVETSKKSRMERMERNGCSGKGVVDNRKKLQPEDIERNKPRKEEKVKEETKNVVKFSRFAENGSDCRNNSEHYTSKMVNKAAKVITGKRKEPEANRVLHDNETRPNKFQKTVLSPEAATENGRNLITCPTITLFSSKQAPANDLELDGEEHKSIWNVGAQSPHVLANCPSVGVKPMGITCAKSPLGSTKPPISSMANGILGDHGSHFGPTKSPSSVGKVHGMTGSQEPSLVSATAGKVNGTVVAQGSPLGPTKPPLSIGRVNGMTSSQESPLVPISVREVNGTMTAHRSPLGQTKPPLSMVHGMMGSQQSPLLSTTTGKVHESTSFQESHGGLLTAGKVNGTIVAHGSPLGSTKLSLSVEKVHGKTGSQEFLLVSSTAGKVNGTIGDHGSAKPTVASGKVNGIIEGTLKRPSTFGKEKHKENSSSKLCPPHPDTKYLTRILSVPKMMELPAYDFPEWLFESKSCPSKDLEVGFGRDGGEQVWSKAVHIDYADIYALPYVIPY